MAEICSEMVGRRAPEKSSFSLTCNLLSQYIKEKSWFGDGKHEVHRLQTTMSLFPGVDVSGEKDDMLARNAKEQKAPAQLTIFYGGKVLVFDNFPAEKAKDLMQLASKGSGSAAAAHFSFAHPTAATAAADRTAPPNSLASFPPRPQHNFSDLPISRKASLHRFLEKRKDRISANAPYQLSSSNDSNGIVSLKEKISQPWLGLEPQISKPGMRSGNCLTGDSF